MKLWGRQRGCAKPRALWDSWCAYPDISPVVKAPAGLWEDAFVPVKEEAIVTLTPFIASLRALDWVSQAGTGESAGVGAGLVVAPLWTEEGWRGKTSRGV